MFFQQCVCPGFLSMCVRLYKKRQRGKWARQPTFGEDKNISEEPFPRQCCLFRGSYGNMAHSHMGLWCSDNLFLNLPSFPHRAKFISFPQVSEHLSALLLFEVNSAFLASSELCPINKWFGLVSLISPLLVPSGQCLSFRTNQNKIHEFWVFL